MPITPPTEAASSVLCSLLLLGALALSPPVRGGETVTIAAEDDWPPYSSMRSDRAGPQGFAVDLVREAFATQGVEVRFETVPFARCMFLAQRGMVAGCFDATQVDDNRETYVWHATPMFQEELAIFGATGGDRRDLTLADLDGKSVGYTLGYTYPAQFRSNPRIQRVSAKSDRVLLDMLASGRVQYILLNTAPGYLRINSDPQFKGRIVKVGTVSRDGFWIAFTKAKPDGARLAALFEQGLKALKDTGRRAEMESRFRREVGLE